MTFGLQEHHIRRINDERAQWNQPDKDIPGTPPDAILIEGFWEQLGREFGWHPFTLALHYMKEERRIDSNTGYRSLWDYLHFNHDLKLLESEVGDLVHFVHKFYPAPNLTLQAKCERFEALIGSLNNQAFIKGVPGATWGDTEYDSLAAAAGYNQAIMNMKSMILKAISAVKGEKEGSDGAA